MTTTEASGRRTEAEAAAWLMTTDAIRERSRQIHDAGLRGELAHFTLDLRRLDAVADYVRETIEANYPDLDIPYHARWRHFTVGTEDRWKDLVGTLDADGDERARIAFDLVVTSVLLDAGAGDAWRYRDEPSRQMLERSEGLAIASFDAFRDGLFSSDPANPLRADAASLTAVTKGRLAAAFQVESGNPLAGLEGRAGLMNRLGAALAGKPELFGTAPTRIGHLYDHLKAKARNGVLDADTILQAVLTGFGDIWPGRIELAGINLGDTWRHPAAGADDPSGGLVPFHKLSQWLTYSLIEPLEAAGIDVTGMDRLTALAEYRNGGLLVDFGVIRPRYDAVTARAHAPDDEVIVEWRALTIALIEEVADKLRARLGLDAGQLPLAKVLEGGTWAAGRRIARTKRTGGGPPIRIVSDGSVF